MILGVGIDLMEIVRMEEALSKEGFLDRFFSPEEKEYIVSRGKGAAESAAGCFAAKEAALKAMGCDIVQGYYFARPMPAKDFETYLKTK